MDFREILLLYENVNWFAEDLTQGIAMKEKEFQIAKPNAF